MNTSAAARRSSRRSRSKTLRALESDAQQQQSRSETPRGSRKSSRASSPAPTRSRKKKKKGGKSSGSSSSKGSSTQSSSGGSGRGYNPNLVNYKDSEYHYGSDFEDEDDAAFDHEQDLDDDDPDSKMDSDESDVLSSVCSTEECDVEINPEDPVFITPDTLPLWLAQDQETPELHLPDTSKDLALPPKGLLDVVAIYETLIHYRLILRLSPFRLEDFCWAMNSDEQSNLLSEVHIALLKALLRADEKEGSTYGPIDQKDSFQCIFYFVDSVTWPENLKTFLSSNEIPSFREAVQLMKENEYPFGEDFTKVRVRVLTILCNQFLANTAVREYITSEGTPSIEDHCRVCHRLGDMVVCDTCGGTYHLTCLDPPLMDVPDEEEWTCMICKDNHVTGVTDCYAKGEENSKIRHETLGYDRQGNKYWFISRRIFIEHKPKKEEDADDPEVSYFSYKSQFEEVMYALDPDVYETELCAAIESIRPEIEEQMLMTEKLTLENKDGSRKTYLEIENEAIKKVQDQRAEAEIKRSEEEKRDQAEMRSGKHHKDEKVDEDEEKKNQEKDTECSDDETKIKDEDLSCNDDIDIKDEVDIDLKENSTDDLKEEDEIKEENTNEISLLSKEKFDEKLAEELRMTRQTILRLNSGNFYYKLGQEGNYRNYVNSYTTNALALSKVQANEERDKKRYMSHKFSLTDASAFKWQGNLFGTRKLLMSTVRQSLIHLENSIPSMFMHANWNILRKPWVGAVNQSVTSRDFSRALTVLQCCMRPCIMLNVWSDQLGHINLKRITAGMREEKKKMEKREKRESDDRDERLRPFMTYVKYTLGVKHLIVKQKGEEYRSHGQHGWLWLSSIRYFKPTDSRTLGLRAGPYRLAVKYTDTRDGSSKVVLMEPRAFEYLLKRQAEIEAKKNSMSSEEEESKSSDNSKIAIEKKKLEEALRNARLDRQIPPEDALVDVVDVENGLSNPTRILFPKVAKKAHVIDDFLARRLQLKTIEEQCLTEKKKESDEVNDSESVESVNDNLHNQKYEEILSKVKKDIWIIINKLKEDAKSSFQKFNCYSPSCRNYKSFTLSLTPCYSTNCPSRRSPLKEARAFYISVINKAPQEYGITVSESLFYQSFTSHNMALQAFMNLLKSLMQKPRNVKIGSSLQNGGLKSELSGNPEVSPSDSSANKRGNNTCSDLINKLDTEMEESDRIYSSKNTSKKIYLKRVKNSSSDKKSSKIVKYPLAPHFFSKSRKSMSILVLSRHDSKHLARKAGTINAEGFNYSAKVNNSFWPYPCPRPTFRTSWLYRTASLSSIHAIALQMRILWGCIRWDDMFAKPLTAEGKHQVTTDTSIITTEILKQRCSGRYLERNEFLVRKIIIPLDAPKTVVEVTPIRSGLRKRKRAESPQQSEPKVEEEWTDESLLELWEIRAFREKMEKERAMNTVTRSRTGTAIREPVKYDPGLSNDYPKRERNVKNNENEQPQPSTPQQINNKTNRETIQQSSSTKKLLGTQVNSSVRPCTPTIIRRVTNPDGTISLVKSTPTMKSVDSPSPTLNTQSLNRTPSTISPTTKKVFISKDGKIIGTQVVPLGGTGKTTLSTPTVPSKPTVTTTASSTPTQQKVQIVRSSDGKIQVKGLLPGQQLVQMPDGKLQIFSQPNSSTTSTINSTSNSTISNSQTYSNTKPAGYEMKNTNSSTIDSPGKQQIVAQQLPPGSQIPPGMTVFMSNGKTYCIPKAATLAAQQQQQQQQQSQTQSPTITIKKPSLQISPAMNKVQATSPQTQIQQQQQQQSPNQKSQTVSVMSLGSNTVTFRGNQMIVSGPDQAQAQLIAKHLSSGTARLGNIGGKQVLIMAPNSQAEEQQQSSQISNITSILPQNPMSPSQIQPNVADTGSILANTLSSPLKQDVPSDVQLPTEATHAQPEPQVALSAQVTAQLIQTPQGPRIILQGIQGANLSREQLQSIQQQVKTQLLKAQAEAKLQNRVPPTKIAVVLPPSIQARIDQQHRLRQEEEQLKREQSMASSYSPNIVQEPPVFENPKQPSSPSVSQQQQQEQNLVSPLPHKVVQSAQRPVSVHQITSGQRMLVVTQSGQKILGVANPNPNLVSHEETTKDASEITSSSNNKGAPNDGNKFEVTQEYIQQTIQHALTDQDLEPEIEQKLLAFQDSQNSEVIKDSHIDSTPAQSMDDEWQPTVWEQKEASKIDIAHDQPQHNIEIDSCISEETTITTQEEEPAHISPPKSNTSLSTPHRPRSISTSSARRLDDKRRQHIQNKISSMLFRQKEQLKKDIAKKRALQEKELQFIIQKEIDKVKANISDLNCKDASSSSSYKRKKEDDSTSPSNRKKKKSGSSSSAPPAAAIQAGIIKKDKVYCICKTKYDATKFYVGCDTCNNWFHGNCVGITEEMSKTMTEYFCDECKSAKDNQEIYCLCRQPYDDLQFYIGCERCADWFHGRCVGILQVEADNIDEYICPRCDSNTSYNYANLKPLNESDNELVKKLVKQLISNRNSWPFKEPVDPNDVPNYYTVVKEPMDLQTIELRVNQSQYQRLSDFVGDVMRIFENCRYFNQDNSQVLRCAESLENYFAQKLAHVREKVAPS